jgi:predicted transcriptional regulator
MLYSDVFPLIMAAEKTTTIWMDPRTLKRVDGIARAMSRWRAWVINHAIVRYLDYEEWFVSAVKRGLKEAETG